MADAFDALAHPVRREILKLLRDGAMSAGQIANHFDLAKPTLSGHFACLKNAGLVTTERHGTTILYRLNMSVLEEVVAVFLSLTGKEDKEGAVSWTFVHRSS